MTSFEMENLLPFFTGNWTVTINHHGYEDLKDKHQWSNFGMYFSEVNCPLGACFGSAIYSLSNSILCGNYNISTINDATLETSLDWVIQVHTFSNQKNATGIFSKVHPSSQPNGFWTPKGFHFSLPSNEAGELWKSFSSFWTGLKRNPCRVSVIIHCFSLNSWLLDTCFVFPKGPCIFFPTSMVPENVHGETFLRSECWHTRKSEQKSNGIFFIPLTSDGFFSDAQKDGQDLKKEIEDAREKLEEGISLLEEARDKMAQSLTNLEELVSAADDLNDEVESIFDDFRGNLISNHRKTATDYPLLNDDPFKGFFSALEDLKTHEESISDEMDGLRDESNEITEETYESLWTELGYVRGQQFLKSAILSQTEPDFSFLENLQGGLKHLSRDSLKILTTAVKLYQETNKEGSWEGNDYGPVIAAIAKTCERLFSEKFEQLKPAIHSDPVFQALANEPKKWDFDFSIVFKNFAEFNKKNMKGQFIRMIKESNNTDKMEWSGTRNCGFALLLFGGQIAACKDGALHTLKYFNLHTPEEMLELSRVLIDLQELRNGFIHHDLATHGDLQKVWKIFQHCLKGLLSAFYLK